MNDETSSDRDTDGSAKGSARPTKPVKSATAFRTISEVAKQLDLPQHVLRFWETRFPQVRPMKRGGGRRYYRSDDMQLLKRIRDLLYVDGYTIKGVQKLLRQSGSVKNFVNNEETSKTGPVDAPPEAKSISETPHDDAFGREISEIVADLEGLRKQLLQGSS